MCWSSISSQRPFVASCCMRSGSVCVAGANVWMPGACQAKHFVTLWWIAMSWLHKHDTVLKVVAGAAFCELHQKWRKLRKYHPFWAVQNMALLETHTRNCRFSVSKCENWRKSRKKVLVLEASYVKFRSLAQNARFRSLLLENWKRPRAKRSFWKLVAGNLEEVSHETFRFHVPGKSCSWKQSGWSGWE